MGVQEQAHGLQRFLAAVPMLDGNYLEDVSITSGTAKSVQHELGRSPRGYIVTKKSAESTIWDTESTTPERELVLNASASCVVSVWVF